MIETKTNPNHEGQEIKPPSSSFGAVIWLEFVLHQLLYGPPLSLFLGLQGFIEGMPCGRWPSLSKYSLPSCWWIPRTVLRSILSLLDLRKTSCCFLHVHYTISLYYLPWTTREVPSISFRKSLVWTKSFSFCLSEMFLSLLLF